MECRAITNPGKQCSRKSLPNSKYCWQHQNYDKKSDETLFENVEIEYNQLVDELDKLQTYGVRTLDLDPATSKISIGISSASNQEALIKDFNLNPSYITFQTSDKPLRLQ
jgi:hypothetical protein